MGECDPARYDDARPWWVELEAIQRACLFSRAVGNRLYICHMTIAQGAEFLKQGKMQGNHVHARSICCSTATYYGPKGAFMQSAIRPFEAEKM